MSSALSGPTDWILRYIKTYFFEINKFVLLILFIVFLNKIITSSIICINHYSAKSRSTGTAPYDA